MKLLAGEASDLEMARHINSDPFHHMNEWICDYLAERGYIASLRTFRAECKSDKITNVESLIDYINHCVSSLNLQGLMDIWQELDKRLFSRLHSEHAKAAALLEGRLYKLFMVTAVLRSNVKKAQEALEHMANSYRLGRDPEMRDWFRIPYVKHPETDPLCAKYCSKFWQETLAVSLYNFISSAFQTSASSLLNQRLRSAPRADPLEKLPVRKLQDTFGRSSVSSAVQDIRSSSHSSALRSKFNRAIAVMNSNPTGHFQSMSSTAESEPDTDQAPKIRPLNTLKPRQRSSASESSTPTSARSLMRVGSSHSLSSPGHVSPGIVKFSEKEHEIKWITPNPPFRETGEILFHLVCEEDYGKHEAPVVDCVLSKCSSKAASYDTGGCVKVWQGIPPASKLMSTYRSEAEITCLCWNPQAEDLVFIGDSAGNLKLVDGGVGTVIMEINLGSEISALAASTKRETSYLACGTNGSEESQYGIFVIDIATFTIRNELRYACRLTACSFHPEKCLLLCGFNTGDLCEYNIRYQKFTAKFPVHVGAIRQVAYLKDEAFCISVADDNKITEMFLNLSTEEISYPLRHVFALSFDGSFALVRCRNGAKVYKVKGRMTSHFYIERQNSVATSLDWCASQDKSTGIIGYSDGSIRWFRLLHLA